MTSREWICVSVYKCMSNECDLIMIEFFFWFEIILHQKEQQQQKKNN